MSKFIPLRPSGTILGDPQGIGPVDTRHESQLQSSPWNSLTNQKAPLIKSWGFRICELFTEFNNYS